MQPAEEEVDGLCLGGGVYYIYRFGMVDELSQQVKKKRVHLSVCIITQNSWGGRDAHSMVYPSYETLHGEGRGGI